MDDAHIGRMDTQTRLIPRWPGAPGWDEILDQANNALRLDALQHGLAHLAVYAHSKNGRIDFRDYADNHRCQALYDALEELSDESARTCQECGAPGQERPEHPYYTFCANHAHPTR